jgi:hypothetical protein
MREDAERDRDPRSDADAANKLRLIADWAWPPLSDALKACTRDIERGMPLRRVCRRVTELLQLATDIAANPLLAWISTERNFANIALQLLWAKGFI